MDAISYAHSAKQEQRIKKFINDPDSTSGVLTVPKTIASGENITIPSGRVAVLPNVQIDGTLNVQGDVFIPSGATLSGVVEKVTSTDNAIVRFDGTTGKVQNSGVIIDDNNNVGIGIVPSAWSVYKALELGTTGNAILGATNSTVITNNAIFTSGAWKCSSGAVPNKFEVGNGDGTFRWFIAPSGTAGNTITWTNAMTLASSGNLLVGTSTDNGVDKLQVNGSITFKGIGASDANTLTRSGYFSITTSDPGASNIPTYNVTIEVIATPSYGWVTQKAIEILGQRLWIRTSNNNGVTWTAWVEK